VSSYQNVKIHAFQIALDNDQVRQRVYLEMQAYSGFAWSGRNTDKEQREESDMGGS
jgi:hypothetical protein